MEYKYKDLTKCGYEKFSISNKDQNRLFKYRKASWHTRYEFYVKDSHAVMHQLPSLPACIASTLLFPLGVLLEGIANYKEVYKGMVLQSWQCKKYGSFCSDTIFKKGGEQGKTFNELMKCRKDIR
jgi:hypothetical protein